MTFFKNMIRDEQGATAIEYGLIAALIAVAAITAMQSLGNELDDTFGNVKSELDDANANNYVQPVLRRGRQGNLPPIFFA